MVVGELTKSYPSLNPSILPSSPVSIKPFCHPAAPKIIHQDHQISCDSDSDDDSWTAYSSSERSFSDSSISDPPRTPGSVYLDLYKPCLKPPGLYSRPPSLYNENLDTYPLNTSSEPQRYSERSLSMENVYERPFIPRHRPSRSWSSSSTVALSEAPSSPASLKRKRLDSLDVLPPPEKKPRMKQRPAARIPARPLLARSLPSSSDDVIQAAPQPQRRSCVPKLAKEKARSFPPHVPIHPAFPLFYRQFPISSYFAPTDSLRKFVL